MGAVRAPPPAAWGAGPRQPVGNRAPIGPPDNRSASRRPIGGGGCRSGAFGLGLERQQQHAGCPRGIPAPAPGGEDAGAARSGAATPRGSGGAAGRAAGGGGGGAAGWGAAGEPLTKRLREGRAASASSGYRSAELPVTPPRWRWPMTYGEGARVGARARLGVSGIGRR
ncbi:hypothetical protein VULLAG_LOCUS21733 [Vulpes lagopus]